ncbi:unnamed protein product [Arctia plantaginis]|uniref:Cytochrome P450 n=1 Tax=Arctia plantaginis TaxID=874455 RepID=A0A8S0Z5V1_ARCPL|nr:unnamed protein product [Arctia plantaginis]
MQDTSNCVIIAEEQALYPSNEKVRRWKIQKFVELSKELKCGIKSYPLIGHAHLLAGGGVNRMTVIKKFTRDALKNGGLSYIWIGSKFYVVSVDAADVEVILKKCLEKDNILRFVRKLIGNGLAFATVPIWRPRRKISAPTFSQANLNMFAKVFAEQSESMVKQVKSTFGDGAEPLWKYMAKYTFHSVCETALGVKLKVNGNTEKQLMESFDILLKLMTTRMVEPWLQLDALYKLLPQHNNFEKNKEILRSFVKEIIKEKRKKNKENIKTDNDDTKVTKSFLDLYIESSGGDRGCTDEELLEETLVMLLAGTDTSAVGLCFTICMLAQYPDVQEKVFQELQEVFGDSERQVVVEDLPRLKYLEAVFRESLRLYPPVPVIVRAINEDTKLPSGVTLKKGCGFLALIWGLHRNPLYWGEDAEQFRPERFLEGHSRHPAAFVAFSHGPRNCLGYQYSMISLKIALATFLRTYRVLPRHDNSGSGEVDQEPMKLSYDIMMKDVDGFKVRLVERKNDEVF